MDLNGLCWWRPFAFPVALKASTFSGSCCSPALPLKESLVKKRSVLSAIKGCINTPRNKSGHHLAQLLLVRLTGQSLWRGNLWLLRQGQRFEEDSSAFCYFKVSARCHSVSLHHEKVKAETEMTAQTSMWFAQGVLECETGKPSTGTKAPQTCTLWLSGLGDFPRPCPGFLTWQHSLLKTLNVFCWPDLVKGL